MLGLWRGRRDGYVIGGGEIKIDLMKMEAILKGNVTTNVTKVSSFVGES